MKEKGKEKSEIDGRKGEGEGMSSEPVEITVDRVEIVE